MSSGVVQRIHGVRYLLEYSLMRSVVAVLELPPRSAARTLGRLMGSAVYCTGVRRATVLRNLAIAFPEKSEGDRARIALDCFRHLGEIIVELSSLPKWKPETIMAQTRFEEADRFRSIVNQDKGVVLATAHFGAFDMGPARLSLEGHKVTGVYQGVRNPYVDNYIRRIRTRGSQEVVNRRGFGMRKAFDVLRKKEVLAILADQDAGRSGMFIPFFGREASSMVGPAEMALRTGAVMVTGFIVKIDGLYHHLLGDVIPHTTVEQMMRDYYRQLENAIRKWPEQYFWLHRRYKTLRSAGG